MTGTLVVQQEMAPDQLQGPSGGPWTYEDWLQLPDDGNRYEVIDGVLYMSPPPRIQHQLIASQIVGRLTEFLRAHRAGIVLFAPTGVRVPNQPVPLQPDILVMRAERLDILGENYVEGAPDLVMEILSPSNWSYDRQEKMRMYQAGGVIEYWIVDALASAVEVYVLEQGTYRLVQRSGQGEGARSQVLPGFEISVDEIFQER